MKKNRRPCQFLPRHAAALAAALFIGALTGRVAVEAQDPPFVVPQLMCYARPSPETDMWPRAVTDALGSTAGVPFTFPGTALTANDTAAVTVRSVGPVSAGAGTITGADPFTFTPAPGFVGEDVFPYEIVDAAMRTTMGLARISVTADAVLPIVDISAPLGGTVAGEVTISATASDNVGVAGVKFFDGAVQIGLEDATAPFGATWDTTLVANGSHSLSAVARDAAGNTATSVVVVEVRNNATSTVPSVVGLTQATAVSSIEGVGLVAAVTATNSPSAAIDTVISQNPPGGDSVATGSSVALVVSLGALVPDIVGSTQVSAASAIAAAGLTAGTATGANSAAPVNTIISQSLAAGTSVAPGTPMSFVYSLGAGLVMVPVVINETQADATVAITGAGLALGAVTTATSTTIASGKVISQDPVGGTMLAPGSPIGLVVSSGSPAPPDPEGGPVLAFGFEEASGTAVTDSSAAPITGTIRGALRVATGKIGRALSFDGVNDWVTVADTTASKIDLTRGMTVEAWVNPTAMAGWETVVMKERGAAGTGFLSYALYAHDGAPQPGAFAGPAGYLRPAPAASTTDQGVREGSHAPLPLNQWTHLATTYDGANMRLYINGVLVATRAQTGNIAVGNQALRIGGNNVSGEFFNGLIDEVRIYNRALSAAEITADMTTPVVP